MRVTSRRSRIRASAASRGSARCRTRVAKTPTAGGPGADADDGGAGADGNLVVLIAVVSLDRVAFGEDGGERVGDAVAECGLVGGGRRDGRLVQVAELLRRQHREVVAALHHPVTG